MELVLFVVCLVLALTLGICVVEVYGFPRRRHAVLVQLHGNEGTLRGVLWARKGRWLVLKDAHLLRANGESLPADGEVLVDRSQVSFIQALP